MGSSQTPVSVYTAVSLCSAAMPLCAAAVYLRALCYLIMALIVGSFSTSFVVSRSDLNF